MPNRIYLDYAAATPVDPRVFAAMEPFLTTHFGNPSSLHQEGVLARKAVEVAREKVASLISAHPDEILFTSGTTESVNLGTVGYLLANKEKGREVVVPRIEHAAGLALLRDAYFHTIEVPTQNGSISSDDVLARVTSQTNLVSLMWTQNELGTIAPMHEIAVGLERLRKNKKTQARLHSDAAQAVGVLDISMERSPVDLLSFGSAKMYGPKGVGALFVRRGVEITPFFGGGSQEKGRRAGTENVPAIIGFGEACILAQQERAQRTAHLLACKTAFLDELAKSGVKYRINGEGEMTPHITNITFFGIDGEELLIRLDAAGIAASAASACKQTRERSHVLQAIGMPDDEAQSTLRFSFGKPLSVEDATRAGALTGEVALRMLGARS